VGPRAGLDAVAKRKIPPPTENRTPISRRAHSVVTMLTVLPRLLEMSLVHLTPQVMGGSLINVK
jgi:hypothetical protein